MNLYLRKIDHSQAPNNYRVVLKIDDEEIEIGSGTRSSSVRTSHGPGELIPWSRFALINPKAAGSNLNSAWMGSWMSFSR
jgi:hypothetical protein